MNGAQFLHGYSFETLDALRQMAGQSGGRAVVSNSFSQPAAPTIGQLPQGLQFFDFDVVGRQVYLEVTPLLNRLPRRGPVGGTAMFWREINDINSNKTLPGVSEGKRGARIARSTTDRVSKFAGFGLENSNTFEAQFAAQGVANPRELARLETLKALRMAEERVVLYANQSVALGTPAAPTAVVGAPAAGEVSTTTTRASLVARVVALTGEGSYLDTVATGVAATINRTNADGSTDVFGAGSSQKSAASGTFGVTAGQKVTLSVTDVKEALGYAWYIGTAGNERLAGITSINQFTMLADESGATQLASAITADNSTNALEFDGIWTIAADPNRNCYYATNDAQPLTADSTGNILEFIKAFYYFYTTWFASPNEIIVNPLEAYAITQILLSGPAAAIYAKMITQSDSVIGGFYVNAILNPFSGTNVKITVHPFLPAGSIIFYTYSLPYPIEKLGNIWEIVQRQPYYTIEWPLKTRENEVGIYVDEGLKCEFTAMQGVLKNVKSKIS